MEKKLIFLDIDGTLTSGGTNIPPQSAVKAIKAARDNGHKVFLCTGRNRGMLKPLLAYGFDGYIGSAGGYVCCGDEVIFDCPMSGEQGRACIDVLHRNGVYITIEARDDTYGDEGLGAFVRGSEAANSELARWRKVLTENLGILPISQYRGEPLYKVVFMCLEEEQLREARALLEKDFRFVCQERPDLGCMNGELINRAFDKGRGVLKVCEYYGFDRKNTIGFGDSLNDLEMIETAGIGVCMENGADELKKRSDMICPPVEKDGLAEAFSRLGLI